ncbi:hypothetical protein Tco_0603375 [Tanacetum coccineum]
MDIHYQQGDDDEDDGAYHATVFPLFYHLPKFLEPLNSTNDTKITYSFSTKMMISLVSMRQNRVAIIKRKYIHKEVRVFLKWIQVLRQGIARSLREEKEVKMLSDD